MKIQTALFSILCCLLLIVGIQRRGIDGKVSTGTVKEQIKHRKVTTPTHRNLPSFGLRNIVADYTFVKFLIYFGNDSFKGNGYASSPDFMEVVISRDPYFMDFYLFLSQSTTVYAGRPDKTIEIINKGISLINNQYPRDGYRVWRYKAMDELLFIGDINASQNSYQEAGNLATQSSDLSIQSLGHRLLQTAKFLSANPDSRQARINAWGSLITTTFSEDAQKRAIREIKELGGEVVFDKNGSVRIKYESAVEAHQ